MVGTITLVYDHHTRELTDQLTEIQHDHDAEVLSTLHVHLDRHHCLETVVVKGDAAVVQSIADKLIGIRGVLHGRLVATTSGLG